MNLVAPLQRMYHGTHRPPSYNDLPQPEGDWQENYQKKQKKYNAFLGASIVALVGTITYVRKTANFFHQISVFSEI